MFHNTVSQCSYQYCGSGMFIPYQGSRVDKIPESRIRIIFFCIFNPKKFSEIRSGMHPSRIRIWIFSVPDPGAKMHRIPDPDPQHWFILKVKHMPYLKKKVFFSLAYFTTVKFVIFASTPERYRYRYLLHV
jgi:hypothetical protein